MTVEEFDRTFKKGQNLTTQKWLDNDDDSILKYVGLDEEKLFVEWEDGSIHIMDVTEYEWILHPTQEKEQDLESKYKDLVGTFVKTYKHFLLSCEDFENSARIHDIEKKFFQNNKSTNNVLKEITAISQNVLSKYKEVELTEEQEKDLIETHKEINKDFKADASMFDTSEMTEKPNNMEKKKLWEWMKLFEEGVELEYESAVINDFVEIPTATELVDYYRDGKAIRIKPQPKEVVLYGADYMGWEFVHHQGDKDTHKITFELDENGKPILGTEKLEEIK